MTRLTIKLLSAEEMEQRQKAKLAKRKSELIGLGPNSSRDPRANPTELLRIPSKRARVEYGRKGKDFGTRQPTIL